MAMGDRRMPRSMTVKTAMVDKEVKVTSVLYSNRSGIDWSDIRVLILGFDPTAAKDKSGIQVSKYLNNSCPEFTRKRVMIWNE